VSAAPISGQTIQIANNGTMNSGAEFVWFSTEMLVRLKFSSQNGGEKGFGKEEMEL
jgi:hypothetical protein